MQREHGRKIQWTQQDAWTQWHKFQDSHLHKLRTDVIFLQTIIMLKAHKIDNDTSFFLLCFSSYQFEMWKQQSCKHFATGLQRTSQCLCCRMVSNWQQNRQRVYAPTSSAPSSQCLMIRLGQKVQNAFWLRAATVGSDEVFWLKVYGVCMSSSSRGEPSYLHVVFWRA